MLTIISAIIGLMGSFGPGLLNYFTTKQNNSYQLDVMKLQLEAAEKGQVLQFEAKKTEEEIKLQQTLYSYDSGPTGSVFIDGLRASVRPTITYSFFLLWAVVEFVGFFYAIHQGKDLFGTIQVVWDQNTQAIFVTIIAFWFGSRVLEKYSIFPQIHDARTSVKKES